MERTFSLRDQKNKKIPTLTKNYTKERPARISEKHAEQFAFRCRERRKPRNFHGEEFCIKTVGGVVFLKIITLYQNCFPGTSYH